MKVRKAAETPTTKSPWITEAQSKSGEMVPRHFPPQRRVMLHGSVGDRAYLQVESAT